MHQSPDIDILVYEFLGEKLDITTLPPDALPGVAHWLGKVLAQIKFKIEENERREQWRKNRKRSREKIKTDIDLLARHLETMPEELALKATAQASGIEIDRLRPLLHVARPRAKRLMKDKRNRRIIQRAAKGWTNAEIAQAENLHEKSVARIIGDIRKNNGPSR